MHSRHQIWLLTLLCAAMAGTGAVRPAEAQALRQSLMPRVGLDLLRNPVVPQRQGTGDAQGSADAAGYVDRTRGGASGANDGRYSSDGRYGGESRYGGDSQYGSDGRYGDNGGYGADTPDGYGDREPYPGSDPQADGGLRGVVDDGTEAEVDPLPGEATQREAATRDRRGLQPLKEEEDPFAAIGIRVGTFLLYPSLELTVGHSSNANASATDPEAGTDYTVGPAFELRSDWSRHELTANFSSETEFEEDETTTAIDGELALRLDIVRTLVADLGATYNLTPESLGDPNLPDSVLERPDTETYGGSASLTKELGRVSLKGGLAYDAYRYEDARLANGEIYDNSDRDYDQSEARLRASYGLDEAYALYTEAAVNDRDYEREFDDYGIRRGSDGYEVLAGVSISRGTLLEGDIGIGYQEQTPDDPTLEEVAGLFYRGSLVWRPTGLTTFRLEGALDADETVLEPGASGVRTATVDFAIEHALRRNLLVTARLGAERADYVGIARLDKSYSAGLDLDYQVNRWLSWRAGVSHSVYDNAGESSDYEDTRVEGGVTVRR